MFNLLQKLAILDAVAGWSALQPRGAHEANVALREHLAEPVVEPRQDLQLAIANALLDDLRGQPIAC